MFEIIFLSILAFIWIIFATVQDLRKREIADWLNFSLIIFALGFRFFWSLFSAEDFNFLYQGLIGLAIFFILGNLFYYSRMFAGGDAKLMISLGAILPFSGFFSENANTFFIFFVLFLFSGAVYSILATLFLSFRNLKAFRKEFVKQFMKNKIALSAVTLAAIVLVVFGFKINILFYLGIFVFIIPYVYIYAKAVDETCMISKIKTSQLQEGDWLYDSVKVGNKIIKAKWDGLTREEIKILKRRKIIVKIRNGIPFTPVFLISFLALQYFLFS